MGKTSLLQHCAEAQRLQISLDDLLTRERANADPALFARELRLPLLLDEIQYAPALLSPLKRFIDAGAAPGCIWMTGSQSFEVMRGVRESLAGRVAILQLLGLSDEEKNTGTDPSAVFRSILETGFPKLFGVNDPQSRSLYLSSYLQTYVERDVRELLGIQKRREFEIFLKLCALRTAQVVNFDDLARNAGVSPATAKEWVSVLEDSFLLRLVHPHFSNRSKRLIKSPKLYFLDAGLAAYLAGWSDPEMARLGPMSGALYETHLFSEITKYFGNRCETVSLTYWRDRDQNEIDLLIERQGKITPLEFKQGLPKKSDLLRLESIREQNWTEGAVLSLAQGDDPAVPLTPEWRIHGPRADRCQALR
ncbi:MAG: ATP-binding protein [Bdellovibrionales bacterium]|nr:ATP-binding protein [Bdellovibrionales bacterium]